MVCPNKIRPQFTAGNAKLHEVYQCLLVNDQVVMAPFIYCLPCLRPSSSEANPDYRSLINTYILTFYGHRQKLTAAFLFDLSENRIKHFMTTVQLRIYSLKNNICIFRMYFSQSLEVFYCSTVESLFGILKFRHM